MISVKDNSGSRSNSEQHCSTRAEEMRYRLALSSLNDTSVRIRMLYVRYYMTPGQEKESDVK